MPKMKSKSSAKKRFSLTASGKIRHAVAYKRHGMSKRTPKANRQSRRTEIMADCDAQFVRRFLPYGR